MLGMVVSLLTAALVLAVVPAFERVFSSFGDSLPWQTLGLLWYYPWVVVLPVAVLALGWRRDVQRSQRAAWLGVVGSALVIAYALWGCYSPVFY